MEFLARWEGGRADDPNDPGGLTQFGVTQETYDRYRRRSGQSERSVDLITEDEVAAVYLSLYWHPLRAETMDVRLAWVLFDAAVQHGVERAARMLQIALNGRAGYHLTVDGRIGPMTLQALGLTPPLELADDLIWLRLDWYQRIAVQRQDGKDLSTFLRGWLRRMIDLRKHIHAHRQEDTQ